MSDAHELRVLLVRAGELACAIPLARVVETMRALPCRALPNVPEYVLGASIIRGRATPVVDLAVLLGQKGRAPGSRYVLLAGASSAVALAVGEVQGIIALPASATEVLPRLLRDVGQHHVASLGSLDAELAVVLTEGIVVPPPVLAALSEQSVGGAA